MTVLFSLRHKLVLALMLAAITTLAFSMLLFRNLDNVVHGDLYRYGLQFSYDWAGQYWTYSRLMTSCLAMAMVLIGISIALLLVQVRSNKTDSTKLIIRLFLASATVVALLAGFLFYQLDGIVNIDLYRYGLTFSDNWAVQYWTYARSMLALVGYVIASSAASIVLLTKDEPIALLEYSRRTQTVLRPDWTKVVPIVLTFVGAVALVFSIFYTSSVLALIGLGLLFWGAILFYVHTDRHVKEILLDKTALPSLANLGQIIGEMGYEGKGIYLPPEHLNDDESVKIYVGARTDGKLPLPEDIQRNENRLFLKNPEGLLITPTGIELTSLFEKTLGTNFKRVDLRYLEKNIPKLLTQDLEIAQSVDVEINDHKVRIRMKNSIYQSMCSETRKLSNVCGSLGCPFCSAIACALAKATGKPVIIEENTSSDDDKTIDIEFRLLEKPTERKGNVISTKLLGH